MDKSDKIILWFGVWLVLETIPTWFSLGWYWYDLSVDIIISSLILCLSFLSKQWFVECFMIFIYYIKLTNIISLYAAYAAGKFPDNIVITNQLILLNNSKPILNVLLYIWLACIFTKYVKGWKYKLQGVTNGDNNRD